MGEGCAGARARDEKETREQAATEETQAARRERATLVAATTHDAAARSVRLQHARLTSAPLLCSTRRRRLGLDDPLLSAQREQRARAQGKKRLRDSNGRERLAAKRERHCRTKKGRSTSLHPPLSRSERELPSSSHRSKSAGITYFVVCGALLREQRAGRAVRGGVVEKKNN